MARRCNGEGMIRKRTDGRWESRIMVGYKDDGKPAYKSLYGKTRTEAREKLKQFQSTLPPGFNAYHNYTFTEWADLWFENHKDSVAPTTQEHYKYTLHVLKEHFDEKKIRDIKPYDIEAFFRNLRDAGYSRSRMAHCSSMLYQIFHKAEANDFIVKNPVRFADKPRYTGPVKRREAFTAEEVQLLLKNLPMDRIGLSIRLLLGTGMRTQELLALEPCHIAEDGSVIKIRQAIKMVKGTVAVGAPKSRNSYRDIPVPPNIRWCAVQLRNTDHKYIWEEGKKDSPCNPSFFRKQFRDALRSVKGVRILTPHSCRHTYVSQLQALSVDLQTIQSIVGHADMSMTLHYLHVQESIRQEAVSKFAEAFGNYSPQ